MHPIILSSLKLNYTLACTNGFKTVIGAPDYQTLDLVVDSGTKWVEDVDGTLVQSPAGYPAMPGCRLATTVAEGAQLGPELWTSGILTPSPATANNGTGVYNAETGELSCTAASLYTYYPYFVACDITAGVQYQIHVKFSGDLSKLYSVTCSSSVSNPSIAVGGVNKDQIIAAGGELTFEGGRYGYLTNPAITIWTDGTTEYSGLFLEELSVRLVIPTWLPTDTDGSPLFTVSQTIRTPQGSVDQYDVTYPGVLVEPAATNKCTCRKVNPTATTGISNAGGGVVSIADAPAGSIAASGLSGLCTSGKVYKVILSTIGGVGIDGTVANTNPHALSAYVMTEGEVTVKCRLTNTNVGTLAASTDKFIRMSSFVTPSSAGQKLYLYSGSSSGVFYFIMPELVESPFLTSPIMPKPGEDDLTSVTRPADNVSFATPSWLLQRKNDIGIIQRIKPVGAGQTAHTLCSYTDANGEISIVLGASSVTFRKRVGGVNTDVSVSYTHAADTLFEIAAYQSSAQGMGLAVRSHDGSSWSAWSPWSVDASTANAVIAATTRLGSQTDSTSHIAASVPMTRILRIPTNLSAAGLQAWLIAKATEGD